MFSSVWLLSQLRIAQTPTWHKLLLMRFHRSVETWRLRNHLPFWLQTETIRQSVLHLIRRMFLKTSLLPQTEKNRLEKLFLSQTTHSKIFKLLLMMHSPGIPSISNPATTLIIMVLFLSVARRILQSSVIPQYWMHKANQEYSVFPIPKM